MTATAKHILTCKIKVYVEATELCDITEENVPAGNITQTLVKNESITYFINKVFYISLY